MPDRQLAPTDLADHRAPNRFVATAFLVASLLPCAPIALAQDQTPSPAASDVAAEFSDPLTTLPQIFHHAALARAIESGRAKAVQGL